MTRNTEVAIECVDLGAALAFYVDELAFRLDMIMPADAPRLALLSGQGVTLRLAVGADPPFVVAQHEPTLLITRASTRNAWVQGRAGMEYRDLIPGRAGGRFIASHIRIREGGPTADYVHHHNVRFQMIYCRRGWVRVVYEDQGPPFVMREGDCVLQPPHIRHRVLESSPGLEVIEIANPAEHATWRDHDLELPTSTIDPQRKFGGQRFVRHIAADSRWDDNIRDLGIAVATDGLAGARVLRLSSDDTPAPRIHNGELLFFSILEGRARLRGQALGRHTLEADDACVVANRADYALDAVTYCEVLEVALPAR